MCPILYCMHLLLYDASVHDRQAYQSSTATVIMGEQINLL